MDEIKQEEEASNSQEDAGNDGVESESEESDVVNEENEEGSNAVEEVDFDTELEKERKRLGLKIDKEREKRIAAEKNSLSREEAEKLIDEKVGQVRKDLVQERAELIAERLAKTPAQKELILLHYRNRIIPSGNLEEDMRMALALANRNTTDAKISELESTLKSKKTTSKGGSDAGQPVEQKPKQKYSQDIIDAAKFAGVTPEEFVKQQNS